jgi:hypothetical protein
MSFDGNRCSVCGEGVSRIDRGKRSRDIAGSIKSIGTSEDYDEMHVGS